jgi:DNA-binding protein H-NS
MKDAQLQKMTLKALLDLKNRVDRAIQEKRDQERSELRDQFRQLAAEKGISWSELVGSGKGKPRGPVAAKFADPKDPSNTWSGRGRMPKWLSAKLKAGAKLESFRL